MKQTKAWTVRKICMGSEGHPEFEYYNRKEDAIPAAEAYVKRKSGNKATVIKSKTGIVIHKFNSQNDLGIIKVHKENIPFSHRDGIHNLNRQPGITTYRWKK
jgi:hypothetical protein